jgi:hypothetical protein
MAAHFYDEAQQVLTDKKALDLLITTIEKGDAKVKQYALQIENEINSGNALPETWIEDIHQEASNSVKALSKAIIKIYPLLGIRACSENHPLNLIFRDYFTATQHYIFSSKEA